VIVDLEPVEYRPSRLKSLLWIVGTAGAAAGCAWLALRAEATSLDRVVSVSGALFFGFGFLVALVSLIANRAFLRLDDEGIHMVDNWGRERLSVPWSSVSSAYEATAGKDPVVVLVAADTPSDLEGTPRPRGLEGPGGSFMGYGYIVNPAVVDVRPDDLIGHVERRLEGRLWDWDPRPMEPEGR
jgi:hypothetical protein